MDEQFVLEVVDLAEANYILSDLDYRLKTTLYIDGKVSLEEYLHTIDVHIRSIEQYVVSLTVYMGFFRPDDVDFKEKIESIDKQLMLIKGYFEKLSNS